MRCGLLVFDGAEVQADGRGDATEGEDAVAVEQAGRHPTCEDVGACPAHLDVALGPALADYQVLIFLYFTIDGADLP